jgi:hypothetical protein
MCPDHQRIAGAILADDFPLMRADVEFAARAEVEDGPGGVLDLDGCVDADLAFGIKVHVQDAGRLVAIDVYPGGPVLETGLRHALLHKHLPVQEEHDDAVLLPGSNLVGVDEDRLGVAGNVPDKPKQIPVALERGS